MLATNYMLWFELCPPKFTCQNVTLFGDRVLAEVIKLE